MEVQVPTAAAGHDLDCFWEGAVLLFKQLEVFTKTQGLRFVEELDLARLGQFRSEWKDICRMGGCSNNKAVGHVAIKSRLQLVVKNTANDLLPTMESEAVARPVLRIDACRTNMDEILNEVIFSLVSCLSCWYFSISSYCTAQKCGSNEQQ